MDYPVELRLALWVFKLMFPFGMRRQHKDEIIQELCLIAMRCRAKHDPLKGKLSTYFARAAFKSGRALLYKATRTNRFLRNGVLLNFRDVHPLFHLGDSRYFATDDTTIRVDEADDAAELYSVIKSNLKERSLKILECREIDEMDFSEIG